MSYYKYYISKKDSNNKKLSSPLIVFIEDNSIISIQEKIYKNLEKKKNKSFDEVVSKYQILNIEPITNPNCDGCLYSASGQRDHMDCPNGCLHEKDMCLICQNA
jgi:hypothetical protein